MLSPDAERNTPFVLSATRSVKNRHDRRFDDLYVGYSIAAADIVAVGAPRDGIIFCVTCKNSKFCRSHC